MKAQDIRFHSVAGSTLNTISVPPTTPDRSKPALAREATGLWGSLTLSIVIVITTFTVVVLLRRSARMRAQANRNPTPTPVVDAWAESGRRMTGDTPLMHGPERTPKEPPPDTPDTRGNYEPPNRT